jgi:hypothetical protein
MRIRRKVAVCCTSTNQSQQNLYDEVEKMSQRNTKAVMWGLEVRLHVFLNQTVLCDNCSASPQREKFSKAMLEY